MEGLGKRARDILTDTQRETERVEAREGWREGSVGERMGWISNPAFLLQALASLPDSCMFPLPSWSLCFSSLFLLCLSVPVLLLSGILASKSSLSCTILRLFPIPIPPSAAYRPSSRMSFYISQWPTEALLPVPMHVMQTHTHRRALTHRCSRSVREKT